MYAVSSPKMQTISRRMPTKCKTNQENAKNTEVWGIWEFWEGGPAATPTNKQILLGNGVHMHLQLLNARFRQQTMEAFFLVFVHLFC